jgi:hypothetical protein
LDKIQPVPAHLSLKTVEIGTGQGTQVGAGGRVFAHPYLEGFLVIKKKLFILQNEE